MTGQALRAALTGCRVLLIDFDGPICDIFAKVPASVIADRMLKLAGERGYAIPHDIANSDPVKILTLAPIHGSPELTGLLAGELRNGEIEAAREASPTSGIREVLEAAKHTGRSLAVVSNNSKDAVTEFLDRHDMSTYFALVVARPSDLDPSLLKPHPYLVQVATGGMGSDPNTVLVGDSISDVTASIAAKIRVIGYAKRPDTRPRFLDAGAAAVVDSMTELTAGLLVTPNS